MVPSFTSYFRCYLQVKLEAGRLVVSADLQSAVSSSLCPSSAAEWTESGEERGNISSFILESGNKDA